MNCSFNYWAKEIHTVAREHGFWDVDRNFGEMIALMHSELSEAWEEHAANQSPIYHINGKPEGVAVELMDCAIRVLDTLQSMDVDVDERVANVFLGDGNLVTVPGNFAEALSNMHFRLSQALEGHRVGLHDVAANALCEVVARTWMAVTSMGINAEDIIKQKTEYNRTRPYKHNKEY